MSESNSTALSISILYVAFLTTQFWACGDDMVFARWIENGISWRNMITVYGVNGRYLGNALGVFFGYLSTTWFWWIRAFFDFVCIVSLVIVIAKLSSNLKNDFLKCACLAIILLFMANEYSYVEFYSYSAGFMNYFVPTFLFLLNLVLLGKYLKQSSKILGVIICVIAFVNCFFVELITVYLVISAASFLLISLYMKKNMKFSMCLMFSSVLGLTLMLSYGFICLDVRSEYRSSIFSRGFDLMIDNIMNNSSMLLFSHLFLTLFISVVSIILICKHIKKNSTKSIVFSVVQICICLLGLSVSVMLRYGNWSKTVIGFLVSDIGIAAITVLYLINLGMVVFKNSGNEKAGLIKYLYFSIWFIAGILSVVSPIGWRCFFPIYVCFIIIGIIMLEMIGKTVSLRLSNVLVLFFAVLFIFYGTYIGAFPRKCGSNFLTPAR